MLSIERRNQIVKILREKNSATVKELSSMFDVTDMTINRDLKTLSEQNIIKRIHGGAIYQKKLIDELEFSKRISFPPLLTEVFSSSPRICSF